MTLEHSSNIVRSRALGAPEQDHDVATIIKAFLNGLPSHKVTRDDVAVKSIMDTMRVEMDAYKLSSPLLERIMHLSASFAQLCYPGCTFEEKKNIALYTWYAVYIDDVSVEGNRPFVTFQQRFMLGIPQKDPVLDAYAVVLHALCDQYDTLPANVILNATFDFVNAACLEPALEALPLTTGNTRFPGFLRDRTSIGISYALFMFTKSHGHIVDFAACFQALPDMSFWIAAINDVLSFYKEELAGEQGNYIYNRALVEGKAPLAVLRETIDELLKASDNIFIFLQRFDTPGAHEAWINFAAGYIAWHLEQDRYRLKDLALKCSQ